MLTNELGKGSSTQLVARGTRVHAQSHSTIHPPMRQFSASPRGFLDYKAIRSRAGYVAANAVARRVPANVPHILALHEQSLALTKAVEGVRKERNSSSKRGVGEDVVSAGRALKERLAGLEEELGGVKRELEEAAWALPNDTHPASPLGAESQARVLGMVGEPRKFTFPVRDHLELGHALGLFDFDASARSSGGGFVTLKGPGVALELALVQWALSRVTAAGFTAIAPPDVALTTVVEGCGFAPRGTPGGAASQVYSLADTPLSLVGTSEIPLASLHAGPTALPPPPTAPLLYAAWGRCFRREAGGAGAATRGLYRLHQFTKVEMFAYVARGVAHPPGIGNAATFMFPGIAQALLSGEQGQGGVVVEGVGGSGPTPPCPLTEAVFARLVDLQASMVQDLGLCARVLDMPSEELGASAYRKVDLEAWMPGRKGFGEVSSASNCMDYQSRRLGIRYKLGESPPEFYHTLNATAAAIPRLMLAILETHQEEDGSVAIPACLHPFMGGVVRLQPGKGGKGKAETTPFALLL